MRLNGRVVQRVEARVSSKGAQVILWGKAGRGTPYVLGELRSKDQNPADLLLDAVVDGRITETPPKA